MRKLGPVGPQLRALKLEVEITQDLRSTVFICNHFLNWQCGCHSRVDAIHL